MTTPHEEGQNPDDLGDRPAVDLGEYPEFFAYGGARGADPGPARGAQPGSYQGYEDYFRRAAEPEPPVRSRKASAEESEPGDGDPGLTADGGSAGMTGGTTGGMTGQAGAGAAFGGGSGSASAFDSASRSGAGGGTGAAGAAGIGATARDEAARGSFPAGAPVDDAPLRSRRGKTAPEDAPHAGKAPRSRRGQAGAGPAADISTASGTPTSGPNPMSAAEPPTRSRGRQVPGPRGERDHAFGPSDNAFSPADNAFGQADNAFGPAAWGAAGAGRAAEAPPHPDTRIPFGGEPPAPSAPPQPDYFREQSTPPAPPRPETRLPFGEPSAPPQPDYFREQSTPSAPPRPETRIPFENEPPAPNVPPQPDHYRDQSFPSAPPHPGTRVPYQDVPPARDYRDPAPAPDYDYRSPAAYPADPFGARPSADPFTADPFAAASDAQPDTEPRATPRLGAQGPGRRRAKRTLASYLWPFRALTARPLASTRIRSRSTAATVWRRLKADRLALAGGVTIVVLILLAVFANVIDAMLGVDPTTLHPALTDPILGPHGAFGGVSLDHPLGVDQSLGRDVLARLLSGARVSLLVAFSATLLAVGIGAVLGVIAGYVGGRVDTLITRLADLFLAFPLFLFALGLTGALSDKAFGLSGNGLRIAVMVFVMGFFNWPYIARIVRAEVLSLREREFIDAARALGARRRWIIGRELMPNLLSPILVYATLLIPTNIIFEAGLSALGIGLNPPAASWGQMMLDASRTVYTDPTYLIVPGMAVFITVLAFNLFGDGLRDALDPTAQ